MAAVTPDAERVRFHSEATALAPHVMGIVTGVAGDAAAGEERETGLRRLNHVDRMVCVPVRVTPGAERDRVGAERTVGEVTALTQRLPEVIVRVGRRRGFGLVDHRDRWGARHGARVAARDRERHHGGNDDGGTRPKHAWFYTPP